MYLPLQTPHTPLEVPEIYENMYPNVADSKRQTYLGMVTAMDDIIGNLTHKLADLNLWDNTYLIFVSDNGGNEHQGASNDPLKKGKGTTYEGGTRTPAFVYSPLITKTR